MSSEMINIVVGLVLVIVSATLTFFFTKLLEKKKVVDYDIFSMSLLRFTANKDRSLVVSADKSLLTGKKEDKGQHVPVNNARVFTVVVRNVGSDDITDASIDIQLDKSAKIIEYETNPASQTNYKVTFEKDAANTLRVFIPYINRRDQFATRVICTDDARGTCEVDIRGLGIKIRRNRGKWILVQIFALMGIPFLTIVIASSFPELVAALGVTKETVTETYEITHIPTWLMVAMGVFVIVPMIALIISISRSMPGNVNEFGSEGKIKVDRWIINEFD